MSRHVVYRVLGSCTKSTSAHGNYSVK